MREIDNRLKIILVMIPNAIFYISIPLLIKTLYTASFGVAAVLIIYYLIISFLMGLYGYIAMRRIIVQFIYNLKLLIVSLTVIFGFPNDNDVIGFMVFYTLINGISLLIMKATIWYWKSDF